MFKFLFGIAFGFLVALYPQVAKDWLLAGVDALHQIGTESTTKLATSSAAQPPSVQDISAKASQAIRLMQAVR